MLLRVPVRRESGGADPRAQRRSDRSRRAPVVATTAATNGRFPWFLLGRDPGVEFNVYIHPGRGGLGRMSADQARQQFDWAHARFYPTIGQAELAAEEYVGFLVELVDAVGDDGGWCRQGGTFFVPLDNQETATKG